MSGENLVKFHLGALNKVRDRVLACLVLDRPDPLPRSAYCVLSVLCVLRTAYCENFVVSKSKFSNVDVSHFSSEAVHQRFSLAANLEGGSISMSAARAAAAELLGWAEEHG